MKNINIVIIIMIIIAFLMIGLGSAFQKKFDYYLISTVKDNTYNTLTQNKIITTYDEYQKIAINSHSQLDKNLTRESFYTNDYLVIFQQYFDDLEYKLDSVSIKQNNFIAKFELKKTCAGPFGESYKDIVFFYPVEKSKYANINLTTKYNVVSNEYCDPTSIDKPILYLYPKEKSKITVKIKNKDNIMTSYPEYIDSWDIIAYPNGDLYDETQKYYYALYWDEKNRFTPSFEEGFYVTKDTAISFLEEKLSIIGLNNKERNEFIMYWLPVLEKNEKSLIYFELTEERQKNNEIIISPTPDSLLRVNMHIKKVNKEIQIKAQQLPTFKRAGFTAIEWGGTKH